MEKLERGELIRRHVSGDSRRHTRLGARDAIDESEHHLAGIAHRETRLAELLVCGCEQTEDYRAPRGVDTGDDRFDLGTRVAGLAFFRREEHTNTGVSHRDRVR